MISETICLRKKSARTAQNIKNTLLLKTPDKASEQLGLLIEKRSAISKIL